MTAKKHAHRCQSCGMPLVKGTFSTEKDGKRSTEWCKLCYEKGAFTEPNLTLDSMIEKSIAHMTRQLKMSDEQANVLAHAVVPTLKRWRK